ncbi:sensor histidine kinase [Amycolatopsis alba]|uniref:histidine kinase n=1 Tax=Amycolatopsis alba DSM 44262 TaxID=1125972 RepID=A0A229RFA8_AMYAL|nr:ATP-binding protein [Amycolatopsis alba]OXM45363.1 two-component sensor histidine kinase [Amycolatopsis alba DSM 44262]
MGLFLRLAGRCLPRRTVRLRLTLLYGGLFLLCGAGVLTATYFLVRHAVQPAGNVRLFRYPLDSAAPAPAGSSLPMLGVEAEQVAAKAEEALAAQRQEVLHQLLVQSGIALAMMVALALALGWWVAGRVLRRLRTITAAARKISATNLHQRLAPSGPDDELKELGDTFDELLGRLEAAFQAQRQFVANASHELRTPLARQRTIGQVALDDPDATMASLRAAHERILVAGAQQERLIEAMLTLTRGHGGIDVRHPFDLGEMVTEVVDVHRPPDLTLRTTIEPCLVSGHRALAERLVVNLVDNAIRHNVPGGWVEVSCGSGVLTVTNSGPVVPATEVDRLFQPFQRLGRARTGQGLGLGLSIVQAIATAHDMPVTATPRQDGGLTMRVEFA